MLLIMLLVSLTVGVLLTGLIFMAIGGKMNRKYSTKLMSMRVLMQALALFSLLFLYLLHG